MADNVILEIVNVKQGDCLIVHPPKSCVHCRETLVIDTGNGMYDFTKRLRLHEPYHLMLTHAHADHINGFQLLLSRHLQDMQSLLVPHYYNESILIAQALLHLRGMSALRHDFGIRLQLRNMVANQRLLVNIGQRRKVRFLGDGDMLCRHMQILNPPKVSGNGMVKRKVPLVWTEGLFEGEFGKEFARYLERENDGVEDMPHIRELMLGNRIGAEGEDFPDNVSDIGQDGIPEGLIQDGRIFVREFMMENERLLRSFAEQPDERKLRNLANRLKLKTHQACLVLRCTFDNTAFLFGGDADKSVWNRLIRQKRDISAKYFKIPHHGSKYNLSRRILKYVNPKIAIISHDNARFGRSKDTHPNQEVLNWIAALNIGLVSTNDIRKGNALVWDRDRQNMCDANIEVVDV